MHDNKPNHKGNQFCIFQWNKWIKNSTKMLFVLDDLPSCCDMLDKRAGFSKKVQMHVLVSMTIRWRIRREWSSLYIYIYIYICSINIPINLSTCDYNYPLWLGNLRTKFAIHFPWVKHILYCDAFTCEAFPMIISCPIVILVYNLTSSQWTKS